MCSTFLLLLFPVFFVLLFQIISLPFLPILPSLICILFPDSFTSAFHLFYLPIVHEWFAKITGILL